MLRNLALVLSALSLVAAAPLEERATTLPADAPFSVTKAQVQSAITCPNGIQKRKGGIVYLIHGTGSTGSESWADGPYVKLLPTSGKTYDVCYVDLPGRSLVDAQISAQYVARGVQILAPQSATGKVAIIGHSQGAGLNPAWAIQFYPSIRKYISNYIALSPDFKGTTQSSSQCNALTSNTGGCVPSFWQQTIGSHYLAAQNSPKAGSYATALVPTTSVFTLTDEIVEPQTGPGASGVIPGAVANSVQQLCGALHVADHFTMVVDSAGYGVARATLEAGPGAFNIANFDARYCNEYVENPSQAYTQLPGNLRSIVADVVGSATGPRVPQEPPLQPYVCKRGFATTCGAAFTPVKA